MSVQTIVRLDVWLDVSCVFKTRSEAQRACKGGKILVNGDRGRPHRQLRIGDKIEISMPENRRRQLLVVSLEDTHIPKAMARMMYKDVTPPPSREELELRDLLRRAGPLTIVGRGTPNKRDRRTLRSLKRN